MEKVHTSSIQVFLVCIYELQTYFYTLVYSSAITITIAVPLAAGCYQDVTSGSRCNPSTDRMQQSELMCGKRKDSFNRGRADLLFSLDTRRSFVSDAASEKDFFHRFVSGCCCAVIVKF